MKARTLTVKIKKVNKLINNIIVNKKERCNLCKE